MGNRVSQTASSVVTEYLLDTQPGLTMVLAETTGSNTTRYLHGPRGLHAQETPAGAWQHPLPDGLNSVRGIVSDALAVLETVSYTPYGVPDTALTATDFAFTGEMRDANGLQYHRARYYDPALAVWGSLDPFEGVVGRPMSLNGYSWVEGQVINATDPNGKQACAFGHQPNGFQAPGEPNCTVGCPPAHHYLPEYDDAGAPKDTSNVDANQLLERVLRTCSPFPMPNAIEEARQLLSTASLIARSVGNDDAAINLDHWLSGSGATMNMRSSRVNRMIRELPRWRGLIEEQAGFDMAIGGNPPQQVAPNCFLRTGRSGGWRRVGQDSPAAQSAGTGTGGDDIYSDDGISLAIGSEGFLSFIGGSPPSGTTREEFDWFAAMNAFNFRNAIAMMANTATNTAEICIRVDISDYYAWYWNSSVGRVDKIMSAADFAGIGEPYDIRGSSTPICFTINSVMDAREIHGKANDVLKAIDLFTINSN